MTVRLAGLEWSDEEERLMSDDSAAWQNLRAMQMKVRHAEKKEHLAKERDLQRKAEREAATQELLDFIGARESSPCTDARKSHPDASFDECSPAAHDWRNALLSHVLRAANI